MVFLCIRVRSLAMSKGIHMRLGSFVQVEWPEQSVSEQPPGTWDPQAVQAKSSAKLPELSQKAGSAPLSNIVCMLMGGAAALALAVGTAWVYMGS